MISLRFQSVMCGLLIWAVSGLIVHAGTTPPPPVERYRLEQHGGGLGVEIDETVVVLAVGDASKGQQWVMERLRRDRNWCGSKTADGKCSASDVTVHDWAESPPNFASPLGCYSLSNYVEGFTDFRETGRERPSILVTDTPLVTLQFAPSSADGKAPHILREYVGPLATWWREAETGLTTCWKTTPPVIDGAPLDSRLTTPKP